LDEFLLSARGGSLTPKVVGDVLARLSRRAGLGRAVHSHMLRHTRMRRTQKPPSGRPILFSLDENRAKGVEKTL